MDASETTIYTAFLIAAVTIGSILGYFLFYMVKLHGRYRRLHQSRSETQLRLVEKERTRMAADLHDELGPILSAAKFRINEVDPPSPDDQLLLQQASDHINEIIIRIRQISNNLMPNTLLRKGPVPAIEEFIQAISTAGFSLNIGLYPYKVPSFSQEQAIHIYRMLQEVIHNTLKHAAASRLKIQLYTRSQLLVIICEDDGKGFLAKKMAKEKNGLGLQNLLLRTEMLGGDMFLYTRPGAGTKIIFEIPLHHVSNYKE